MGQEVAANIINDVAIEVGLIPAPINDPFASIDPNILQLAKLLKSGGRTLRKRYSWTHLQYQYTFNTIANQGRYVLPVDYGKYINQTAWNRTNRLPLGGPLSPQEFEYFKARLVGVVFTTLFRILQQQFQVYPDTSTPGGYTIAFEYVSSFWVVPSATQVTSGSWQNATTYPNGTFIRNGGNIYQATQAGSGVSGGFGPTGTGAGITDGTCVWSFISVGGADAPASSQDLVQFDSHLMTGS